MNSPAARPKQSVALLLAITSAWLTNCLVLPSFTTYADAGRAPLPAVSDSTTALTEADRSGRERVTEAYGWLPSSFEANPEHANQDAKFVSRGGNWSLFLGSTEAVMRLRIADSGPRNAESQFAVGRFPEPQSAIIDRSATLRMKLVGANASARVAGLDELESKSNYFAGNDPSNWRTGVANFARVKSEQVYRGVDVIYYGNQRQLEYDFIVAPGASYKVIRIRFEGADRVSLDDDGDLVIEAGSEKIHQRKPVVYQEVNGIKETIAARYVLSGRGDAGFEIGAYDTKRSLIIDPVLSYSTYLGAAPISSVAVDQTGNAYVTGTFPFDSFGGVSDAFVIKLNREGTAVLYSTFLGGSDRRITGAIRNQAFGIAVDSNGNAYVTGSTDSKDFPTTQGAFQTTLPGSLSGRMAAFVTKLNPAGDALAYSTYLGGTDNSSRSSGQGIAVDGAGNAYVVGSTDAFKFPLVNPLQSINRVGSCFGSDFVISCQGDAFISKLNPSGSALIYSTYLGGEAIDSGVGIAVDSAGFAYVVGTTSAPAFPTKNPFQSARRGSDDLFIAKLSVAGNELIYSSLLGGSASDVAAGVAVDSSGNAYITGRTASTDFPTTPGAIQGVNASGTSFKSTDGGTTWSAFNPGLLATDSSTIQLVFDPTNSSTLYGSTGSGLFKSTDGGNSWRFLSFGVITSLVIDPTNPSRLHAVFNGLFSDILEKSTDGGKTWFTDFGLAPNFPFSILIDPQDPSMLYAAARKPSFGEQFAGIFKSTDGGNRWVQSARGVSQTPVIALALAPTKPKRLYTFSGGSIFKSSNRGRKWKAGGFFSNLRAGSLAVDPLNANTIYLATPAGVSKSTDGAETWASTTLHASVSFLVIDPKNPSTIYAAGSDAANADRNFKSTDGGESWNTIGRISANFVLTFAIDPNNASIVYAGSSAFGPFNLSADAFVAKINPTGTALVYSTYLGGRGSDIGKAIEVDAHGNVYLAGQTSSEDFPIKGALQPRKLGAAGSFDAFITKLDPSGDLIYSTYLGGSSNDDGRAIALDAAGGLYIAGSTDSDDFPTVNPLQGTRNGRLGAGFVTKLVDAAGSPASSKATLFRFDLTRRGAYR